MPWFQKRTKFRRISADRSRPLPRRDIRPLSPPGKRVTCYLMTAVFLAGAVLTLNFPGAEPRLRAGEVARRDYRARVAFFVPDVEATARARKEVADRALRVFTEDAAHLRPISGELHRLAEVRKLNDLGLITRNNWGLTEEAFRILRAELDDPLWADSLAKATDEALGKAIGFGIMDGNQRQTELNADRYDVLVRMPPAENETEPREVRHNVITALDYPNGLRDFLAEDEQLAELLGAKPEAFQAAFLGALTHRTTPTLKFEPAATEQALRAATRLTPEQERRVERDSVILAAGERATDAKVREIEREQKALGRFGSRYGSDQGRKIFLRKGAGALGLTAVFLGGFILLAIGATRASGAVLSSNTRLFGLYSACLVTLASVRLLGAFGFSTQWAPIVLMAMFLCVTCGSLAALGATVFVSVLAGLATNNIAVTALPFLFAGSVGILAVRHLRRRPQMFEAGMLAGVVQLAVVWAVWAVQLGALPAAAQAPVAPVADSLAALVGGVLAGAVLSAALPYIEKFFDVATDLRLLEWIDQNQPLMRKLALEAPGTYHHSTVVSNMAEVAAEEIGANALLACAGGYLHDVGKIMRPEYFVENSAGQPSRHDKLSPMLSWLILTAHTKDGIELAADYGVPSPIRRIIAEHHGTSVTEYFYNKARVAAQQDGGDVSPDGFRYRGPRPRTPEAAIVMLADSAESATRSLETASPARIEKLVHSIVERRLEDGQLDDCRMNITDVRTVEKCFVRSLTAMAHPRIRYPSVTQ